MLNSATMQGFGFRRVLLGGFFGLALSFPFPRQQFMETGGRQVCDAGEDIGELGFGVHIVEPCGHDEGKHGGRAVRATVGTGEEPSISDILPMSGAMLSSGIDGIRISSGPFDASIRGAGERQSRAQSCAMAKSLSFPHWMLDRDVC